MYPYRRTWRWWLANRYKHLVDGLARNATLRGRESRILDRRLRMMNRWLLVRIVVLVFLSASAISASVGVFLDAAGGSEEASAALGLFNTVARTFSSVFLLLFFLANRVLGQLESDVLMVLTVGERAEPDER